MGRSITEIQASIYEAESDFFYANESIDRVRIELRQAQSRADSLRSTLEQYRQELQEEEDRQNELENLRARVTELEDRLRDAGLPA